MFFIAMNIQKILKGFIEPKILSFGFLNVLQVTCYTSLFLSKVDFSGSWALLFCLPGGREGFQG